MTWSDALLYLNDGLLFFFFLQVYKRKNEAAKKEYLKALAEYRANKNAQVSPVWAPSDPLLPSCF